MESRNIHEKVIVRDLKKAEENQLKRLRDHWIQYSFPKEITPNFETVISISIIKLLRKLHSAEVIVHEPLDHYQVHDTLPKDLPVDFSASLHNTQYRKVLDYEVNTWIEQVTSGARVVCSCLPVPVYKA
ncbi:hypothetical protein CPB86DRAFT_450437 [Serendipita vermifera]|nr:hypothetical protein CPB86DRAFT_450437 [Serendipita vermifera]